MDRNSKIASLALGAGLITLPFGGFGAAFVAAVAGGMVGNKQFPAGERPWRELEELINEGEHGRLEFKVSLSGKKGKSPYNGVIKSIAAFANSDGGEILIGIDDDGQPVGLESILDKLGSKDKFELALNNAIRTSMQESVHHLYRLKFDTYKGHLICRIEVEKSNGSAVFTTQGEFYTRNGCQSISMTPAEYAKLKENEDI